MGENPCLRCGACCAHYRVSFYWAEADEAQGGAVPPALTEELPPFRLCMQGTNCRQPRCAALLGEVGREVRCAIYAGRPSPCREFGVIWRDGVLRSGPEELARCNAARAAWGLPPLTIGPARPDAPPNVPTPGDAPLAPAA
ncbi:MAG TPA: YkgJ family cysteine cluster protein [Anaerolineae bacterium]|nr:YkgJ family cysteine cluster protein [Anaerolineae bacterium]HOQ98812.1 YkgJ family cysteine cluster protein [Anaerolineae bacterium]HPL30303.1 YkgJ family cysteine cluster protein [Anaerolineae bacterium]